MQSQKETEYWEPFVVNKFQLDNITNSGSYLVFDNNSTQMVKGYSSHNCIFWNYTAPPIASMSKSCFKFDLVLDIFLLSYFIFC